MKYRLAIKKARINIKSLAAESKIIKFEILKTRDSSIKNELHDHKVSKVRPEARLANLAIAFLKGRTRSSIDKSSKIIDIKRLHNKLIIFAGFYAPSLEDLKKWLTT